MNERLGGCGAGEGSGRGARVRGPKDPRRPWKGEERRSTRPVAAGGGAAGGERRWLRAAAPLRRGRPTAARAAPPRLRLSAPAGVQVAKPPRSGSGPPAPGRPAPPPPPPRGRGVSCLRWASVGAGAAAGAREARGPAGALGAEELGARRRTASSSCRAGPRRSPAAAGAEHKRGRRPGQQRARSGSGSGSGSCLRPLSARPQGRQPQQHYRRRPGVKRPRRRRPRTARGHQRRTPEGGGSREGNRARRRVRRPPGAQRARSELQAALRRPRGNLAAPAHPSLPLPSPETPRLLIGPRRHPRSPREDPRPDRVLRHRGPRQRTGSPAVAALSGAEGLLLSLGYVPPWGSIMNDAVLVSQRGGFSDVRSSRNTLSGNKVFSDPGLMKPPIPH
ncbi:hypothetical protein R6Z07M_018176 [Ovis aries]